MIMNLAKRNKNVLLRRAIILVAMIFLLQACASTRMGEQLQQGKASFTAGNFKTSLHELLPVAAYGTPEAEYAVGYIYYNGYGVTADSESGIFWMTKAADKGYLPAKKALEQIKLDNLMKEKKSHEIKVENKPSFNTTSLNPTLLKSAPLQDEVLQSLAHPSGKKANYTLQLYGSYKVEQVKDLQKTLASQKLTRSWHTKREGKDWFVLTCGEFKTAADANLALNHLPESMRSMQPWVRPIAQLETA